MNNKIFKIVNIGIFSTLGVLMIVSAFFDYQLMHTLGGRNNLGGFFNRYGELPATLIAISFFNCLAIYFFRNNKILFCLLSLLGMFVFAFFTMNKFFGRNPIIEYGFLITFIIITLVIFYNISEVNLSNLIRLLILAVALVIITVVLCQIVKMFWGRIRFRDLYDSSEFTHWFIPQGINGHLSFFSGHTVAAGTSLFVMFIPSIFKNVNLLAYRFSVVFFALFTVATAYSRIVVGAHYLSDVVFSIIVTYATILLLKKYFLPVVLNNFSNTHKNS